jgi:hypothetical protein
MKSATHRFRRISGGSHETVSMSRVTRPFSLRVVGQSQHRPQVCTLLVEFWTSYWPVE